MDSPRSADPRDRLSEARGIVNGLGASAIVWAIVGVIAILVYFRP